MASWNRRVKTEIPAQSILHERHNRIGPVAAILGTALLFVGTYLHPMSADPNVPLAAFTEYAADHHWVASHLMQLLGVLLIAAALVLLNRKMANGPAADWAVLGMVGTVASTAVASALQAIDGVALKAAVNSWAASLEPARAAIFQAAFAIRQIEIGLASITGLLFGLTFSIMGIALLVDRRFPRRLGIFAIAGGVPTSIAGVVIAYTGFSDLAMEINMPSNSVLLVWMIVWGVFDWTRPTR
jgi:hypothetical protein